MKNLFIFFLLTSQLLSQKYEKDISYKEKRILEYKKEGIRVEVGEISKYNPNVPFKMNIIKHVMKLLCFHLNIL